MALRIKKRIRRGFTLIELIVVIGVMVLVGTLTLVSFPQFSRRVAIEQEAGKLSLALRRAQSYAIAVREFGVGSGIFPGYGVFVSATSPEQYLIFGDPNTSSRYEESFGETVEVVRTERGARISDICGDSQSVPPGPCGLSSVEIFYKRPGPSIALTGAFSSDRYNDIKLVLTSLDGFVTKSIIIWSTGQISIQ